MKRIFLLFILCTAFRAGYGCSCVIPEGGLKEYYDQNFMQADFVVTGKVLTVKKMGSKQFILLKVASVYKGKAIPAIIIIRTSAESGLCGLFPDANRNWLILGNSKDGKYGTGLCTGSITIDRSDFTNDWTGKRNKAYAKFALDYLSSIKLYL